MLQKILKTYQDKTNKILNEYRKDQREKAAIKQQVAISKRLEKNIETLKIYQKILKVPSLSACEEETMDENSKLKFLNALSGCTLVDATSKKENVTESDTIHSNTTTSTSSNQPHPIKGYAKELRGNDDRAAVVISLWQYITAYGKAFNIDPRLPKINYKVSKNIPYLHIGYVYAYMV